MNLPVIERVSGYQRQGDSDRLASNRLCHVSSQHHPPVAAERGEVAGIAGCLGSQGSGRIYVDNLDKR
jgi:hypothetical protein